MRQVVGPGALGRPRGIGWRGRWEGGSGWGIHVNPWLIHVNVWQKPLQYCKVISLQLIKIKKLKKEFKRAPVGRKNSEFILQQRRNGAGPVIADGRRCYMKQEKSSKGNYNFLQMVPAVLGKT